MLGGFHKIKDQMLVSMTLYIFRGTSPSSGVQMYILLNMFHLEPTPLSQIFTGSSSKIYCFQFDESLFCICVVCLLCI